MTTATLPPVQIHINNPISYFSKHLEQNNRILFSGPFGIGKTYFLQRFFDGYVNEIKEKYNVFHLFPVNYQIATNEDVFELIKYDILYHLLGFDWVKIDDTKFSESLALQSYLMNNSVNVIAKVLQCIPIVENAGKAVENLQSIYRDYSEHKKKINENEEALLAGFFKRFEQQKGSVHEFDAISEFIYTSLMNCNEGISKDKHKKNVLIIDDLDRIDPEHIFRLLNVFSAHTDKNDGTNKFGFDKIIFVCDVENIRNIFAAKYGQNTDFSGYIDKFYSSEVFYFDNKVAILEFLRSVMASHSTDSQRRQNSFTEEEIGYIEHVLFSFVEGKGINLRQIFANVENLKDITQGTGYIEDKRTYSPGIKVINSCLRILGGQKEILVNAIEKSALPSDSRFIGVNLEWMVSLFLPILTDNFLTEGAFLLGGNIFLSGGVATETEAVSYFFKDIEYKLKKDNNNRNYCDVRAEIISPKSLSYQDFKSVFVEAVNVLDKKGFLK